MFSILVEYISRQSWSEAFEAVIPQRKFDNTSKKERREKSKSAAKGTSTTQPGEGEAKEDEEEEDEDSGMSDVEEAPFDWSRADGGDQADDAQKVDEEAAINV